MKPPLRIPDRLTADPEISFESLNDVEKKTSWRYTGVNVEGAKGQPTLKSFAPTFKPQTISRDLADEHFYNSDPVKK